MNCLKVQTTDVFFFITWILHKICLHRCVFLRDDVVTLWPACSCSYARWYTRNWPSVKKTSNTWPPQSSTSKRFLFSFCCIMHTNTPVWWLFFRWHYKQQAVFKSSMWCRCTGDAVWHWRGVQVALASLTSSSPAQNSVVHEAWAQWGHCCVDHWAGITLLFSLLPCVCYQWVQALDRWHKKCIILFQGVWQ